MNAEPLLNNCNFSDWGGWKRSISHGLEKQSSYDCACVPARAQNKGFVVYTKQANVFRSMISEPGGQSADAKPVCARDAGRRQRPGTASKHTAQTTEVDPVTVTVEICLGILPRLCQQ